MKTFLLAVTLCIAFLVVGAVALVATGGVWVFLGWVVWLIFQLILKVVGL